MFQAVQYEDVAAGTRPGPTKNKSTKDTEGKGTCNYISYYCVVLFIQIHVA